MEKYFALINKGIVQSVAVGDDDFYEHIKTQYETVIDVTDRDRPTVGDSYYSDSDLFVSNSCEVNEIEVDESELDAEHLTSGTDEGFEPFKISKYAVRYVDGMIKIGCKKYSGPGFMDALHKVLIEKQEGTLYCFTTETGKPAHGKFEITWEDAQKLYDVLSKVKW